jgi:hypothetical protein
MTQGSITVNGFSNVNYRVNSVVSCHHFTSMSFSMDAYPVMCINSCVKLIMLDLLKVVPVGSNFSVRRNKYFVR